MTLKPVRLVRMSEYMCSKSHGLVFAYLLLLIYSGQALEEKYPGDSCYLEDGAIGICKSILECPSALANLGKSINPPQCGFMGELSIICCENKQITTTQRSTFAPRTDLSGPGSVAAQQCQEYSKWVYRKVQEIGFSFDTKEKYESTCKLEYGAGFIIGGKNASLEEFPHAVAIGYGTKANIAWKCAGSLISNQWILTAAHCNSALSLGNASFARIGFVNFKTETGEMIPIIQRIKYPEYKRNTYYNDISLMKLKTPVTFSSSLRPACLRYLPTITEKKVLAVGWGLTYWRGQQISEILQKVQLSVYDKPICDNVFLYDIKLKDRFKEDSQLCIGELKGEKDTCRGDSGGPVSVKNPDVECMHDIIGITSAGSEFCGTANSASLYTRVYHYLDWIERTVWPEFF